MTPNPASTIRLRGFHRPALLTHFLALSPEDRRLRFGAAIGDEGLRNYVERIDFARDCLFAVQDDALAIIAAVHVATLEGSAELGLSVLEGRRGQGLGAMLMERAVVWLRNRGTRSVYVHCLTENAAMMHIARKNGMRIAYAGSETDARLELEAATAQSFVFEWLEEQRGIAQQAARQNLRLVQALLGQA
jgi:GNAT superfamily N-acetyltransferase